MEGPGSCEHGFETLAVITLGHTELLIPVTDRILINKRNIGENDQKPTKTEAPDNETRAKSIK